MAPPVEYVNVDAGLESVPQDIDKAQDATLVDLSRNSIQEIPHGLLSRFKRIERLVLSNNSLSKLPNDIGSLRHLEVLDISYNELETVPRDLYRITSLRRVDLSNNRIRDLHDRMYKWADLKFLDVSNNQLRSLPSSLGWLDVTELKYSGNPNLRMPPAAERQGLRSVMAYLQILGEQHRLVDNHIGQFTRLKPERTVSTAPQPESSEGAEVKIARRRSSLEEALDDRIQQAMDTRVMNLRRLKITEIPERVKEIKDLRVLDVRYNYIEKLDGWFGDLPDLAVLALGHNQLESLSPLLESRQARSLGVLNISDNRLKSLPDGLEQFSNLQQLYADRNSLTDLPSTLSQLRLVDLFVNENPLKVLPPSICAMKKLVKLSVACCDLDKLPEDLGSLPNLRFLDVSFNNLKALPLSLGNLSQLSSFNGGFNPFGVFPDVLTAITSLSELNLDHTGISAIPSGVAALRNLAGLQMEGCSFSPQLDKLYAKDPLLLVKVKDAELEALDLSCCGLENIPPEVFNLQSLTALNLSENKLKALPPKMSLLTSLRIIRLQGNPLEPPFCNLRDRDGDLGILEILRMKDEKLTLSGLGLEDVPIDFVLKCGNIKQLRLARNEISVLPESIGQATTINTIVLDNNKICSLPTALLSLPNLQTVMCAFNSVPSLPDDIGRFTQIQALVLQHNLLETLPNGMSQLTNLKALSISSNKIKELPTGLDALKNLKLLDISGNEISAIPSSFSNLINLRALRCSNMMLSTPPSVLYALQNLYELDLTGNLLPEISHPLLATNSREVEELLEDLKPHAEDISESSNNLLDSMEESALPDHQPANWKRAKEAFGLKDDPIVNRKESAWDSMPTMDLPTIIAALGDAPLPPPPKVADGQNRRPQTRSRFQRYTRQTLVAMELLQQSAKDQDDAKPDQ